MTNFITINDLRIEFVLGDITQQAVDAIVNAANSRLSGGGGVDGAIHRAGGPSIMDETSHRYPDGCPTGSAVITSAGDLPAKYVIHAVGPVWNGGGRGEDLQLASAYRTSLTLANKHACQSVALPALSTGAYRYPLAEAATVAVTTAAAYLRDAKEGSGPSLVRFVLFSDTALGAFRRAASEIEET